MEKGAAEGKGENWEIGESNEKKKRKKNRGDVDDEEEVVGCWIALKTLGNCISSRSKVDSSVRGTGTVYAENKSAPDTSRDQLAMTGVSSTTTSNSNGECSSSNSRLDEELKSSNVKNDVVIQGGSRSRNRRLLRSPSVVNGSHLSPYHNNHPYPSPKPVAKS